jgi:hypothetical protein
MMLLRSSILALLVVLPAVLAKKKKKKGSKLIQEIYVLVDEDSSLSLEVDFFAIMGFLQMAMINIDINVTFPYYETGYLSGISVFNNNPQLLDAFQYFMKPTDPGIATILAQRNITSQHGIEHNDTGLLDNFPEQPLLYDAENYGAENVLSDISLLFNIAGTQLISTGLANRIFDVEDIIKNIPKEASIMDQVGEPTELLDVIEFLSDILKDQKKEQVEWESEVSYGDNYFSDACTVIDGQLDFMEENKMHIEKQKCDIGVCTGTYDDRGVPNCFNLRFSGKRFVDIYFNTTKNAAPRENLNSFTASLVGGTGRFAMTQGQARVLITKQDDPTLDNIFVLIEYIRLGDP